MSHSDLNLGVVIAFIGLALLVWFDADIGKYISRNRNRGEFKLPEASSGSRMPPAPPPLMRNPLENVSIPIALDGQQYVEGQLVFKDGNLFAFIGGALVEVTTPPPIELHCNHAKLLRELQEVLDIGDGSRIVGAGIELLHAVLLNPNMVHGTYKHPNKFSVELISDPKYGTITRTVVEGWAGIRKTTHEA